MLFQLLLRALLDLDITCSELLCVMFVVTMASESLRCLLEGEQVELLGSDVLQMFCKTLLNRRVLVQGMEAQTQTLRLPCFAGSGMQALASAL